MEVDPVLPNESTAITPLDDCYFVSDATWAPNTPIPVLRFETKDWPAEAKSGIVRFWCTDLAPKSLGEIEIPLAPSAKNSNKPMQQTGTLKGTDVRYQVHFERDNISLVFIHETDTIKVSSLAPVLEFNGGAVQVERQYGTSQRMSIHRFVLPPKTQTVPESLKSDKLRFQILDFNDIKKHGLHLANPVAVSITPIMAAVPSSTPPVLRR